MSQVRKTRVPDEPRFTVRTGEPLTTICAWCKLVRRDGRWQSCPVTDNLSHGICPTCFAKAIREVHPVADGLLAAG